MMRKRWLVVGLIGCIVLAMIYTFIASWHNFISTELLSLHTVTWQEVGMIKGIVNEEVVTRTSCP